MVEGRLKWYARLGITLVVSTILFLIIWVFSQFREPPGFSILMNTLLLLIAYACFESIRLVQGKIVQWNFKSIPYLREASTFIGPVLVGTLTYCVLFYLFKWFDHFFLLSEPPLLQHMVSAGLIGLILSLIFGLILWVVTWRDSFYQEVLKGESYKTEIAYSKLNSLRKQLDPHFLFNNFNTIYYLIDENPEEAKKSLKNVSNIYRHVLKHSNDHLIEALGEYKIMLQYLEVLEERFGQAFELANDIQESHLSEKYLPPLVLHELLENVIKHNRIDNENRIVLNLTSTPDSLILSNNRNPKKVTDSTKKGLENIVSRYNLLTETNVLVEKNKNHFKVKIPLLVAEDED
ncbi:MAG: histidine kinase [Bacteroidota bacterium]